MGQEAVERRKLRLSNLTQFKKEPTTFSPCSTSYTWYYNLPYPTAKEGYYIVYVTCFNCNNTKYIYVPKGTLLRHHLKNVECENCGCKEYIKREIYQTPQ